MTLAPAKVNTLQVNSTALITTLGLYYDQIENGITCMVKHNITLSCNTLS